MNLATILVLAVVIGLAALSAWSLIRDHRSGKHTCGGCSACGGCSGCGGCGCCHSGK